MSNNNGRGLPSRLGSAAGLAAACLLFGSSTEAADYLGTVDDYVQITQLQARYDYALDNWDGKAWAAVFTEDGVFHMGATRCVVGHEQMIVLLEKMAPSYTNLPPQQHVTVMGPVTYIDKDHAWVHSPIMLIGSGGFIRPMVGGTGLAYTAAYDDTLRRVNGRWLIADRSENTKTADFKSPQPCAPEKPQ
jgi:SnoaL-like domain